MSHQQEHPRRREVTSGLSCVGRRSVITNHDRTVSLPEMFDSVWHLMSERTAGAVPHQIGPDPQSSASTGTWESQLRTGNSVGQSPNELTDAIEKLRREIQLKEGTRARLYRPIRGPRRIRFPERGPGDTSVRILVTRNGSTAYARQPNQIGFDDLVFCHPMRDFSRRNGQTNKPVAFYSRTVGDLVACESQHERRFAILADWHEDVVHIAAQPFTIDFPPDHELDSHTPDFAVISRTGTVVIVDVKWPTAAVDSVVIRRHALVGRQLWKAGMNHAVWSNASAIITDNLANFAAARVPENLMQDLAPKLLAAHRSGIRVRDLLDSVAEEHHVSTSTALVVLRRLLWEHQLNIDTMAPFTFDAELMRS